MIANAVQPRRCQDHELLQNHHRESPETLLGSVACLRMRGGWGLFLASHHLALLFWSSRFLPSCFLNREHEDLTRVLLLRNREPRTRCRRRTASSPQPRAQGPTPGGHRSTFTRAFIFFFTCPINNNHHPLPSQPRPETPHSPPSKQHSLLPPSR